MINKIRNFTIYYLILVNIGFFGFSIYELIFDSWGVISLALLAGIYAGALSLGLSIYFITIVIKSHKKIEA
jgi:uncharacterized membrane protein YjjP (DUF1212 family)